MLIEHRPNFRRQPIPPGTKLLRDGGVRFTAEEWSAAREIDQQRIEQAKDASRRLEKVIQQLVAWLGSGELVSALRQLAGGAVKHQVTADQWLTEQWWLRFVNGQMRPYDPFRAPRTLDSLHHQWIFVTRKSLDHCLRSLMPVEHTSSAETKTRRWLEKQMRESPEARPPGVTKAMLLEKAKEQFKVGRRPFDRAWVWAIEETGAKWGRPGAPLKLSK
jgi:hypothetical protein